MALIAEFSIPTESFALAETLPDFPDVAVEVDRIAGHSPGTTMPCFWASEGATSTFSRTVEEDVTVDEVRSRADFDGECLYHVRWSDEIDRLVEEMVDHQGVILESSGQADRWLIRLRFMTRDQLEDFREYFDEQGPSFRLEQLFDPKHPRHVRGDISPEQHEAITTAIELGYFKVPREASAQDVADRLGISDQAVSERLRRGTENLGRHLLQVEPIHDVTEGSNRGH